MRVGFYLFFVVLAGMLLALVGGVGIVAQHRAMASFSSTSGTVTRSALISDRIRGYRPRIEYTYIAGQRAYSGNMLTPLPGGLLASKATVQKWVERFRVDQAVTVYIDPLDPSRSYLVPMARFYPYGMVLLAVAGASLALLPLMAGGFFERGPRAQSAGRYSWYALAESRSPGMRAGAILLIAVAWLVVGGLAGIHYFLVVGPPYQWVSMLLMVYYAGALALLILGARRWRISVQFGEAVAWSTLPEVHLDQPVAIKFEQKLPGKAVVREARVGLLCMEQAGLSSRRLFATTAEEQPRLDRRLLYGEHHFEVPPKKRRRSTPFSRWNYPRIDWYVQLDATLESGHRCWRRFPVAVRLGTGQG